MKKTAWRKSIAFYELFAPRTHLTLWIKMGMTIQNRTPEVLLS